MIELYERKALSLGDIKSSKVNDLKFNRVEELTIGKFYFDIKGNTVRYIGDEATQPIERTPLIKDLTIFDVCGEKQLKLFHILVNNTTNGSADGF